MSKEYICVLAYTVGLKYVKLKVLHVIRPSKVSFCGNSLVANVKIDLTTNQTVKIIDWLWL